jgi:hypothetical protein
MKRRVEEEVFNSLVFICGSEDISTAIVFICSLFLGVALYFTYASSHNQSLAGDSHNIKLLIKQLGRKSVEYFVVNKLDYFAAQNRAS